MSTSTPERGQLQGRRDARRARHRRSGRRCPGSWSARTRSAGSSAAGSSGMPSQAVTRIPARTCTIQPLTGTPSTITRHCAHWPLAQKMPCGLPSLAMVTEDAHAVGEQGRGDHLAPPCGRLRAVEVEDGVGLTGGFQYGMLFDSGHMLFVRATVRKYRMAPRPISSRYPWDNNTGPDVSQNVASGPSQRPPGPAGTAVPGSNA